MTTFWAILVLVLLVLAVNVKVLQKKYLKDDTPEINYSKKFLKTDLLIYVGLFTPATIIVNILSFKLFGAIALAIFITTAVAISIIQYKKKRNTISDTTYTRIAGICTIMTVIGIVLMVSLFFGM